MEKAIDMTPGKPWKLLLWFSFPILIGYLFQQVYTLADRVIVGQFVGADAFSAVGSTTAITSMFMSMCMGASNGAGVVMAQYHGAGDKKYCGSDCNGSCTAYCGGLLYYLYIPKSTSSAGGGQKCTTK